MHGAGTVSIVTCLRASLRDQLDGVPVACGASQGCAKRHSGTLKGSERGLGPGLGARRLNICRGACYSIGENGADAATGGRREGIRRKAMRSFSGRKITVHATPLKRPALVSLGILFPFAAHVLSMCMP